MSAAGVILEVSIAVDPIVKSTIRVTCHAWKLQIAQSSLLISSQMNWSAPLITLSSLFFPSLHPYPLIKIWAKTLFIPKQPHACILRKSPKVMNNKNYDVSPDFKASSWTHHCILTPWGPKFTPLIWWWKQGNKSCSVHYCCRWTNSNTFTTPGSLLFVCLSLRSILVSRAI
jgi:hypothetical protein